MVGIKMKKDDCIKKYGIAEWERRLQQTRDWKVLHREEVNAKILEWCKNNQVKIKTRQEEANRKGGKYYAEKLEYKRTGVQSGRNVIRSKHGKQYRPYKQIIAPDSVLHHEWIPRTADFRGVALVEVDQHLHGFVDVIQILEGEITLLTEEEIKIWRENDEKKIFNDY